MRDLFQFCVDACQELFGEAGPDSAREHETVRTIVADEQRAEVFASSFGERVAADNELLTLGDFEFDPGAAAPAVLVDRIQSLRDQAFEAKLLRDPKQVLFEALQTFRDPDIWRRFFENVGKEFPPGRKRFLTQVFSIHKQKIEDLINKRDALFGAFVILKQLKGRPTFFIERSNFAVENEAFGRQQLQGTK